MSEEGVEITRRAIEAYGPEGLDGVLRYYHPEVEWTSTEDYIERATYRGHEGLRRYFGTMEEQFNDLRIEPAALDEKRLFCVPLRGLRVSQPVPAGASAWRSSAALGNRSRDPSTSTGASSSGLSGPGP
jgi:SnoaL-like protein